MSSTQSAEQIAIAHRSVGTGPPDVVFIHGWAGSGAYFDETIAALDLDHVRATTLDLSGHGESPRADVDWSLDRIDDEILSVVDAIGVKRAVLFGYSMAGKFAQHFALRHPDRVAGLMLVAGTQAAAIQLPAEVVADWYGRAGDVDAMIELERGFVTGPVDEAALARAGRESARIPLAALEGTMRVTLETDFAGELGAIDAPTLVVAGGRDELFTPALLRDTIASRIRGARLAIVDCGHPIPLERPRELAALVEAFLAGLP